MDFFTERGRPSATAIKVHNATDTAMTRGQLVYINGFNRTAYRPTVNLADGTDATKPAQLVVLNPIAVGGDDWADTMALVTVYNTASQAVGDVAYLSVSTAGSIQWAAPTAAGHQVQPVGVCASVATSGDIYFAPGISFETQLGSTQVAPLSITTAKLAANAVTAAKIYAATITTAEIATNAGIVNGQLAAKTIAYDRIADGTITNSQLGAGTLHEVKTSIGHANGTPTIAVLPAGALLTAAWVVCTQTYDATAPTVNIGYAGSTDVIIPTASITKTAGVVSGTDPAVLGTDLWVPGAQDGTPGFAVTTYGHARNKFYAAQTTVIATIAGASGNTTGTADVYLNYIQTA